MWKWTTRMELGVPRSYLRHVNVVDTASGLAGGGQMEWQQTTSHLMAMTGT